MKEMVCLRCEAVMDEFETGYDDGAGVIYCPYCGSECDLYHMDELTEEQRMEAQRWL